MKLILSFYRAFVIFTNLWNYVALWTEGEGERTARQFRRKMIFIAQALFLVFLMIFQSVSLCLLFHCVIMLARVCLCFVYECILIRVALCWDRKDTLKNVSLRQIVWNISSFFIISILATTPINWHEISGICFKINE